MATAIYLGMHSDSLLHTTLMSDDNLILHNLHFITAYISLSLYICVAITPYLGTACR